MKKFRVDFIVKILISACLILGGILAFSRAEPGSFFFLDFPSLIFVVLGAVAMTLMGFSFPEICAAFRHALGSSDEPGKGGLEKSIYFWEAVARNFFQMGVLMTVINFIIMMNNISRGIAGVWNALAICFVTTLYGLILAALSTIAGLRVVKKLTGPGQMQQEMQSEPIKQGHHWNIERIIGVFLFIATLAWVIMMADVLKIFIQWPSLLIVVGGAVLFVLWAGNGEDGLSTTLSFAFAGAIGIIFGLVQMFYGAPAIQRIGEGMTFAILSCVFALVGMMLGGVHRQDHAFKAGKTHKKITISRIAWYGFPVATLMLLFYIFVLILIPVVKK
jgi:flagellar motor component MotA